MNRFMDLKKIYLKSFDKESLINTIQTRYEQEQEDVLYRANLLCEGYFIFQNEWDMERSNQVVQMPLEVMDWNYIPGVDMEWAYMLHRQNYLMDLVLASVYTGDLKYIDHLNKLWDHYIENNTYTENNTPFSWRSLDVGIRLIAWVRLVELYDILEYDLPDKVLDTVAIYKDYLLSKLEYNRVQSNWTAIEAASLIVYLSKYEPDADDLDGVIKLFEACLETQVGSDGLQWEQSFMYHHEVLIACLHVVQAMGSKTSSRILKTLAAMGHASRKIMRPDYKQINFGDSDYEDMRSLLLAFEKISGEHVFYEPVQTTLYDFLFTGSSKSSLNGRSYTKMETFYLDEAGIALVKNNQDKSNFMFSNGPLGGGHGHDDFLHIDWFVKNREFLVDSGRYTYHEDNGSRLYFKSPKAHNTMIVNGQDYNQHFESWSSSKVAEGIVGRVQFGALVSSFQGGHFGYSDANQLIYVERKAILSNRDVLFVIDKIKAQKVSKLSSNFIVRKPKITKIKDHYQYEDGDLSMLFHNLRNAESKIEKVFVSPEYNVKEATSALQYSIKAKEGMIMTAITNSHIKTLSAIPVYDDSEHLYSRDIVECFMYHDAGRDCYLLIQHQEPNDSRRAYCVEGKLCYGRLIYFEKVDNEITHYEKLY